LPVGDYARRTVSTIGPSATLREAALQMVDQNVGCIIVVEDSKPCGMLSDRDVSIRTLCDQLDSRTIRVDELMSKRVVTIPEEASLAAAVEQIRNRRVRRLPVVSQSGELTGLITLDDLLMLFASELQTLSDTIQKQLPVSGDRES